MDDDLPITERANPTTTNFASSTPAEMVQMMGACEREIFNGWEGSKGIHDDDVMASLQRISEIAADIIQNSCRGKIILSGSGTSGRIAYMVVRYFNELLETYKLRPCFEYLVSGGDTALVSSSESWEDDSEAGRRDLDEVLVGGCRPVLYVGITCGLSSAYVAGQLMSCMKNLQCMTPVLIGFNPLHLARDVSFGDGTTFRKVAYEMLDASRRGQAFVVNPIIGPEPLAGSSRLKGGTATKILLEAAFLSALGQVLNRPITALCDLFTQYECGQRRVYDQTRCIGQLIRLAGESLSSGARLIYVGTEPTFSFIGLMDASECLPTFGTAREDVRGYMHGDPGDLRCKDPSLADKLEFSYQHFCERMLPTLQADDLLVLLSHNDSWAQMSASLESCSAKKALVNVSSINRKEASSSVKLDCVVEVDMKTRADPDWLEELRCQLALKATLNAVTTGAHALKGDIYGNRMISVQIGNSKLFDRAVELVKSLAAVSREAALASVLRAIYRQDELTAEMKSNPVTTHLNHTKHGGIVQLALVMLMAQTTYEEAQQLLAKHSVTDALRRHQASV